MYAVTQDFMERMRADKRRVDAKITIDYTNPLIDQSIAVSASEQANVSYPQQTADTVLFPTHKWASLDGSWVLDGSYHLAPAPKDLTRYQFGWWSAQLAGPDGSFTEPYPALTVTHIPRPVHRLRVVGDSARGEYPVDFRIDLYGPDDTLLRSEVVTGNTVVEWSMTLPAPVLDVAKQVLTLTRWSHPGRQAKILEFFTSIQETYYSGDVIEIRLLEEREASQGSLPVGNISSNEISLRLANESGKFDVTNRQSPLWGLLKPNRRIRAWLGLRGAGDLWGDGWYAPFDRDLAVARRDGAVQEPLLGYVATLRPGEGRVGGAVAVEEGTTNLVDFDVAFRSWSSSNSNMASLTTKTGRHSFRVQGTSTVPGAYSYIYPAYATTNVLHSASSWVRNLNSKPLEVRLRIRDGSNGELLSDNVVVVVPPGQELPIRVTSYSPVSLNQVTVAWNVYSDPDDGTVDAEIYMCQLEAKPFATSFVDGTRAAGVLRYSASGIINPDAGTIAFWYRPEFDLSLIQDHSTSPKLIQVGDYHKNGSFTLWHYSNPGRLSLYVRGQDATGWTASGTVSPSDTGFARSKWSYVAVTWDGLNWAVYVDGRRVLSLTSSQPLGRIDSDIWQFAHGSPKYSQLFDELLILPYAASEEHIARLYAQTRPLYDEWVPLGTYWSLDWDSPDDTLEAQVRARDRLELLRKSTYQPGSVQQNVSLYTLAEQVLQDAGLQPGEYVIDPALQQTVIPWAWLSPTSHREALRIIAEAALAVVYADRDGVVRIEGLGSVPETPVVEITGDDYFPPLRAPSRQDQVANEIVVATQPLRPADTPQEVYRSTTPITVPAGQTVTVTAKYGQPPVIEAVASLDAPPGVSITAATYYAWGAEVGIQNTGASQADVTLVITGRPLSVQGGEQVVARDEQSIIENGTLRYQYPDNSLVQTLQQAQAIAQALLASAKDPRRDIEVEWRGNPALELGDRVTVVGQDVHVIRQEITWAGALSARLVGRRVS